MYNKPVKKYLGNADSVIGVMVTATPSTELEVEEYFFGEIDRVKVASTNPARDGTFSGNLEGAFQNVKTLSLFVIHLKVNRTWLAPQQQPTSVGLPK
jgi:hypothetical protein